MSTIAETTIEADPKVPIIRMRRAFNATPEQLYRAHTDPRLFARWAGPNGMRTRIEEWDARSGGSWRYVSARDGQQYAFRGCFHGSPAAWRSRSTRATPSSMRCSPMALSDRPAERHRQVSRGFTDRVRAARSWDAPAPVAAWQTH